MSTPVDQSSGGAVARSHRWRSNRHAPWPTTLAVAISTLSSFYGKRGSDGPRGHAAADGFPAAQRDDPRGLCTGAARRSTHLHGASRVGDEPPGQSSNVEAPADALVGQGCAPDATNTGRSARRLPGAAIQDVVPAFPVSGSARCCGRIGLPHLCSTPSECASASRCAGLAVAPMRYFRFGAFCSTANSRTCSANGIRGSDGFREVDQGLAQLDPKFCSGPDKQK